MFINIPKSHFDDIKVTWLAGRPYMTPIFQNTKNVTDISFPDFITQLKNELSKKESEIQTYLDSVKKKISDVYIQTIPNYSDLLLRTEFFKSKWIIIYQFEISLSRMNFKLKAIKKITDALSSLSRLIQTFPIFISYLNPNISVIDEIINNLLKNSDVFQNKMDRLQSYQAQHQLKAASPFLKLSAPLLPSEESIAFVHYMISQNPPVQASLNPLLELISQIDIFLQKKSNPQSNPKSISFTYSNPTSTTNTSNSTNTGNLKENSKKSTGKIPPLQEKEKPKPKRPGNIFVEFSKKVDSSLNEILNNLHLPTQERNNIIWIIGEILFRRAILSGATFGLIDIDPSQILSVTESSLNRPVKDFSVPDYAIGDLSPDITVNEFYSKNEHLVAAKQTLDNILFQGTPMEIVDTLYLVQKEIYEFLHEAKRKVGLPIGGFMEFDDPFSVFIAITSVSNVPNLKIAAQYSTCFSDKQMELDHASAQMLLVSWLNWYSQSEK